MIDWIHTPPDAFRLELPDIPKMIRDTAFRAARKTGGLTDDEKFAICAVSGCPTTTEFRDGKFILKTSVPCSVVRIEDKWHVFQKEESHA